jgi:hypothetical protein
LDLGERLGVKVTRWRDTMQEAFHLGNLPQGLKPLAYRTLGVTMRSWEDVVRPASIRALHEWCGRGMVLAGDRLQVEKKLKTKVKLEPGASEKIFRHVLRQILEGKEDYDPWEALDRFFEDGLRGKKPEKWERELIEKELGERPILGIGNCELEEAIAYACGDADCTGRVAVELERVRGRDHGEGGRLEVMEGDWDQ